MDDLPRQTLIQLVARYGPSLSTDPKRTEGLLRDFCGAYKPEIFVLVSALKENVAADLLSLQDSVPYQVSSAQLTRRLQDNLALAEDAARWAVDSWALALGLIQQPSSGPLPRASRKPAPATTPTTAPPSTPQAPADERLLRTLEGHTGWVHSVAFSPDGRLLASGSQDETVRLWDVSTALNTGGVGSQNMRWPLQNTSPVLCVTFSDDGRTMAWGSEDGTIQVRDVARSRKLHQLKDRTGAVHSVAFSPDGRHLASTSANTVVLWDVATGLEVRQFKGHTGVVQSVAFSPDGRLLASAGGDETVRLWDVSTGLNTSVASGKAVEVRRLEGHREAVWCLAFSPDGRTLTSGSHDETVRLWDVERGQETKRLKGHEGGVNSVAFSPNGRTLAAASLDTVVLWDVERGRKLEKLKGHNNLVQSVAFGPDGRILASGSWDRTARLWQVS